MGRKVRPYILPDDNSPSITALNPQLFVEIVGEFSEEA
jgi:hypothetical protein